MTYLELRNLLNTMSAQELDQPVVTYSGDIDDTIRVIGTSLNTDEIMGEKMLGYPENQLFLDLE